MAKKYFYKDPSNTTFILDGSIISPGLCMMSFRNSDTIVDIKSVDNKHTILSSIEITNLLKENGEAYANKDELVEALKDFF